MAQQDAREKDVAWCEGLLRRVQGEEAGRHPQTVPNPLEEG